MEEIKSSELVGGNFRQRIVDAISAGDFNVLDALLVDLNAQLIGGNSGDFGRGLATENRRNMLREFLENAKEGNASAKVHLGDGGMSRLILSTEFGEIDVFLTNNCTEKVLKKWEEIG